jgi:NADH-quinone oxidoreductase B subunit
MGLVDKGRMPAPLTKLFNISRSYSLWVYQWGLACCAIEMGAAFGSPRYDVMRLGVIPWPASPRQADFVCVSGTVTDKMAPAVKRLWEQMPEPKYAISMGSCANCGGPYWDSYSVTKGVDQIIPIDVYVPGCPPRPEALLEGVVLLQQRIKNEDMQAKWKGDEFTTLQAKRQAERGELTAGEPTGQTTHDISTDPQPIPERDRPHPIVVGGGPIE